MIESFEKLAALKEQINKKKAESEGKTRIIVHGSTCGIASGSKNILDTIKSEVQQQNISVVEVVEYACIG